jgi:hypothetical protein
VVPSKGPAQIRKSTVTLWAQFGGRNYEVLTNLVAGFNQATPDVEVKATLYSTSEILSKHLAAVARPGAGLAPVSRDVTWRPWSLSIACRLTNGRTAEVVVGKT